MKGTNLSLCMIVKNEEEFIDKCLTSVKDLVDEIIIVDTGSTDRTIEICQSHGAVIEKFKWNGSFADARNFGINKATGEWILWLDADEELDSLDKDKLHKGNHFADYDVLTIHLVNYHGKEAIKDQTTDIAHTRLFRRNTGIKFINKIHECLEINGINQERIGHVDIKVHHYGYLDPVVDKKGKFERNIKMLKEQLKAKENVYWAQYYIAMEHYRKGQFKEAFKRVNASIKAFLLEGLLPPSMVYKLKYSILISMGSFEGAWPGIEKAIILYPDYVDLYFFKGLILYSLKKYNEALKTFETCIEMGEDNIHHLILRGVGTFQAWHYKGLCEENLGKEVEAVISYLHSIAISPEYLHAFESMAKISKKVDINLEEIVNKNFQGEDKQSLKMMISQLE
ncbi:glycosyltransferase family 2 protein [Heyndrickxia acidicola]|uniref:Glycosyltransferase n=1 Tax=Heyndrickxia acidicola TaxID=209389 RepID=A0ABU6MI53_9BACI|nr:glycosyltransferase family 2 protein [Heyndrickxia acidicola]MED1204356.1 glycosyltransferase [Heyndrickxia acidicola]